MVQWKWWSRSILSRAKRKGIDLRLNAAIEIAPLNSLNVRKRFSFLLRLQESFIAIELETNYFDRKETSKNSKICRLLAKIFARWGRKSWQRSNVGAQKSSKHWLSRLSSLQVLTESDAFDCKNQLQLQAPAWEKSLSISHTISESCTHFSLCTSMKLNYLLKADGRIMDDELDQDPMVPSSRAITFTTVLLYSLTYSWPIDAPIDHCPFDIFLPFGMKVLSISPHVPAITHGQFIGCIGDPLLLDVFACKFKSKSNFMSFAFIKVLCICSEFR
ncbi:hypothetical protein IEQ34_016609 [Dendrobium chrysotoxum]|uniref:Uncharacterized protein n=1 Tax=Dendrobium chrysotoxum TaxID=161865 RepID=A0AAV7GG19_DENCH|nr:hypothetical protein IEQ34_016609 [Dendrobium chrysotoxum]